MAGASRIKYISIFDPRPNEYFSFIAPLLPCCFSGNLYETLDSGSWPHNGWYTLLRFNKRRLIVFVSREFLHLRPNTDISGRCEPNIFPLNKYQMFENGGLVFIGPHIHSRDNFSENESPQLLMRGSLGFFDKIFGSKPQENSGCGKDDSEDRNYLFPAVMNEATETIPIYTEINRQRGNIFLKGVAGGILLFLLYAELKRR